MGSRLVYLAVLLCFAATACSSSSATTEAAAFDEVASRELPTSSDVGQAVGIVSLPDVSDSGVPFFFRAQDGEVLIVYFGFTSCPDICPTTLADLKSALSVVEEQAGNVSVAMVTIDPDRDSAEALVDYVQWFIPGAHALRTADPVELKVASDAFGAEFSIVTTSDAGTEVLHTAYLYGVDDSGKVVATWPFGTEPDAIASDIASLLAP